MVGSWAALRRRILTPSMSETKMSVRGFTEKSPESRELLETVGRAFLTGYGYAAEARTAAEAEARLEQVPRRFRGFAYEGAAMGFAVRDGLPLGGRRHVEDLLGSRGDAHVYMVNVGVGWAMARLPRFRWSGVQGSDRLLRWLVLDGYGFHQAYFKTDKYVHQQYREPAFPWPADGPGWYADRVIDQGIGRAMWFVGGTDPELVATMLDKFPESRRPDLYSGAGLAATYAGGGDQRELRAFWDRAEAYRPEVAQASAFAATARVDAGLVVEHTGLATRVFCGVTPEEAALICHETQPAEPYDESLLPAYEAWRQSIAGHFAASGWCAK
ncbi:MAG TPA: DUF1702 family protein [Actinocrinis sp.]|nr:DUF1702 family protein [Actinocrinis sp.]